MKEILLFIIFSMLLINIYGQPSQEDITAQPVSSENKTETKAAGAILFSDYRQFLIYTRDSIMREILSGELADFCTSYAPAFQCERINWIMPINLGHEEIVEILTRYAEYGDHFNFLTVENTQFYVAIKYLIYRTSRSDHNGTNIFPDLSELVIAPGKNIDYQFGVDNNWNDCLDQTVLNNILTDEQVEAYMDWIEKIGLKKARKITKNKIFVSCYADN
jgi:hypothetical protein